MVMNKSAAQRHALAYLAFHFCTTYRGRCIVRIQHAVDFVVSQDFSTGNLAGAIGMTQDQIHGPNGAVEPTYPHVRFFSYFHISISGPSKLLFINGKTWSTGTDCGTTGTNRGRKGTNRGRKGTNRGDGDLLRGGVPLHSVHTWPS